MVQPGIDAVALERAVHRRAVDRRAVTMGERENARRANG
jgi:hypothetical protein